MSLRFRKTARSIVTVVLTTVTVFFALTSCTCSSLPVQTAAFSTLKQESPSVASMPPSAIPTATPQPTSDPALSPVTFAWISDTQDYASAFPKSLSTMTEWIVNNRDRLNIQYVLQTGDLVNDMQREREWIAVETAFQAFVGKIPVFGIAGNHDIAGKWHHYKNYHAVMSHQNYTEYPTFGGEEAQGLGRFDLVTIGSEDYIIIGVGYGIQRTDYNWLNNTLAQYADRTAILISHWYLEFRPKTQLTEDSLLLHRIVAANPNVRYVLCGHRHGIRHVEETYDDDKDGTPERTVQAIMVDYQGLPNGGDGYLSLLTVNPVERTVSITAYSPVLDDFNFYEDESIETYTMPLSTVGEN